MTKPAVDYSSKTTPADYKCNRCGTTSCKLWRETAFSGPRLLCVDCAAKDQKKDISTINELGCRKTEFGETDHIGIYVPAVPTENGYGYWMQVHVPDAGCQWWNNLPLRSASIEA